MNPLVSIIIPTFNRAYLIGETLNSVLAQTYKNWECIIVDDGSTDKTENIVTERIKADKRFQFYKRPKNKPKGANACRNYGFEQSKGLYIQWFDSDDIMHPKKIEIKVGYAISQKADIVVDTHTNEKAIVLKENPKIETFKSNQFYIDYILGKKPVITNDVMVRRAIIGTLRFDENLHKAQEFEYFSRLFEQRLTYCFVYLPLSYYRESADSISKKTASGGTKQAESLIYLSKLLQSRHPHNLLIVERAKRQGRKTYKVLVKRKNFKLLLRHYNFFSKAHHKSSFLFINYLLYNLITGRGFYSIKPKTK